MGGQVGHHLPKIWITQMKNCVFDLAVDSGLILFWEEMHMALKQKNVTNSAAASIQSGQDQLRIFRYFILFNQLVTSICQTIRNLGVSCNEYSQIN